MTIVACPHGCGGYVDTAKENYCSSCRRGLNETEIVIPEDHDESPNKMFDPMRKVWYDAVTNEVTEPPVQTPVARKASWCWEWHGPANHRMRCRLPRGHDGAHDCKEDRAPGEISVATDGQVVAGAVLAIGGGK